MTISTLASFWSAAVSGAYATAADWTPTGVPKNSASQESDVFLGGVYTSGTALFTVTSSLNQQVGFLDVEANATLSIAAGQFQINSLAHSYCNAYNLGAITVAAGAYLTFGAAGSPAQDSSELENFGTLTVAGALSLYTPYVELLGSGTLALSGRIVGGSSSAKTTLANDDSTIVGSGTLGNGSTFALNNQHAGVIDASGSAALVINTGANWIENAGLIETTGAGGLLIESSMQLDGELSATGTGALTLLNATVHGGGNVNVGASAKLILNNSQITSGGAIAIAAAGSIRSTAGNVKGIGTNNAFAGDALQGGEIDDAGAIVVADRSTLNMNATVLGAGVLQLLSTGDSTELEVFGDGLRLDNTGGVVLSNSIFNAIVSNGAGVQLTNDTRISGAGVIGDGYLRFVNHLGASVVANGSASLTISGDYKSNPAGELENYNDGTLMNTGSGGLLISGGTFNNAGTIIENGAGTLTFTAATVDNGGGLVSALKGSILLANSQLNNQSNVSIAAGATLLTAAGDTHDAIFSNVSNSGSLTAVGGSELQVSGHWTNAGGIDIGGANSGATVAIAGNNSWQLLGAGSVVMANAADQIVSLGPNATFLDKSNLIEGGGVIGDANMSVNINNGATVDATLASSLTLDAAAQSSSGVTYLYNAGVLQSDSAGGLTIEAAIYSPGQMIVDAGAKILAESAVYGPGVTTINGSGTAEFEGELDNDVHFGASAGGQLILDSSHSYYGTTFGFAAGDSIDLRDFAFVAGQTQMDSATSGFGALDATLFVTNGSADSAGVWLQGNYTAANLAAHNLAFQFTSDGHTIAGTSSTGTLVSLMSTAATS